MSAESVDPKAFDGQMYKPVALVVHKEGERIVIGEAHLVPGDGTDLVVSARIDPAYLGIIPPVQEEFSIGKWAQHVEKVSCLDQPAVLPSTFWNSLAERASTGELLVPDSGARASDDGGGDQDEGGRDPSFV